MDRKTSDQNNQKRSSNDKRNPPPRSLSDQPGTRSSIGVIRSQPVGTDSDTSDDFIGLLNGNLEEEQRYYAANRGKAKPKSFKPTSQVEDDAPLNPRDPEAVKALKWRPKEGRPAEHMVASVAALQKEYNPLIKLLGIKIKIIRSDDGDDEFSSTGGEEVAEDVSQKPHQHSPEHSTTESKKAPVTDPNEETHISPSNSTQKSNLSDELTSTASEKNSSLRKPPGKNSDLHGSINNTQNELVLSHESQQEFDLDEELPSTASEEDPPKKSSNIPTVTHTNQNTMISFQNPPQELDDDEELPTTASEEDAPKKSPKAKSDIMDPKQSKSLSHHNQPQESDFDEDLPTTASEEDCTKKITKTQSNGHNKMNITQSKMVSSRDAAEVFDSENENEVCRAPPPKRCRYEVSYPRIQTESRPNFEISDEAQDAIGPLPLDGKFELTASINKFLKPYQRDGVKFLFKHFQLKHGVILGDDMGLGKTIQIIAFLSAAMGLKGVSTEKKRRKSAINRLPNGRAYKPSELGPTCLVICPNSVIDNWANEIKTWGYFEYATLGGVVSGAETISKFNAGAFDILICGFNYARDHIDDLYDLDFTIVVVDEVQKLKSHRSTITKAFHRFKTKIRFGLTGTAMQNDLMELHSLFDWVRPGALGTPRMWRAFVAEPIKHSRKSTASTYERQLGKERATALVEKCWPDLQLRRTKTKILHELPRRTDKIALCPMTAAQKSAYQNLLSDPDVINMRKNNEPCPCGRTNKSGLRFTLGKCCDQGWDRRIFPYIQVFKKIANHLALTYPNKEDTKEKYDQDKMFIKKMFPDDYLEREYKFSCGYDSKLCGKWIVLKPLLDQWKKQQTKVLLFSQSTKMMDILERWLEDDFPGYVRLDGDVPTSERFKRVEEFQTDPSKFIFLASTTAAGVGLTLTAANKVVIFDPSWNPSIDAQAMDRVVRIGQKRDVECIRLISLRSTEELIYHRQVYKQHLADIANTGKAPERQFAGVQGDKKNQGEIFGVKNIFRDQGLGLPAEQCREEYSYAINQFMAFDAERNGSAEEFTIKPLDQLSEGSKLSSNSTEAILRDFGVGQILNHGDVVKTSLGLSTQSQSKSEGKINKKSRSKALAVSTAPPIRGVKKVQEKLILKESSDDTNYSSGSDSSFTKDVSFKDFASFSSKKNKKT